MSESNLKVVLHPIALTPNTDVCACAAIRYTS
jgi:hypothetical protein